MLKRLSLCDEATLDLFIGAYLEEKQVLLCLGQEPGLQVAMR